jgi:amidophosphoribosyltransferase
MIEKCGVMGLYAFDPKWKMSRFIYYGLLALQHRGQETCGAVTSNGQRLFHHKSANLVDRTFTEAIIGNLQGWMGIGHTSPYAEKNEEKIQPVIASNPVKLALCYNGMVLNYRELIEESGLKAETDAQAMAELLSRELSKSDPLEAVASLSERLKGPYSFVALTEDGKMIAARDSSGLKPLVVGSFGFDYGVVASESCAIDVIGADYKADVKPGEAYLFTTYSIERKQFAKPSPKYCAFEFVYLARPDSIINEREIYQIRMEIGKVLAKNSPVGGADVVIGVPETAIPFGMAYANVTKTNLELGFVQTGRRIRSAIKPTQFERLVGVQLKLNPVRAAIRGKNVVLIDDSVVRGNTTKNVVNMMRNRIGAKEIHVRIGSPRLIAQCPFGVEVPPKDELIAAHLSDEEVSKVVGADSFHWLSLDGLVKAVGLSRESLCVGCFTGKYPSFGEEA